jgi:hypothetical protein
VKPWHERFPDIYADERGYWLRKGFEEDDLSRYGVAFTGTVTARIKLDRGFEHRPFKLRVIYPPGYPYVPPKVAFLDPPITRARHQGVDGAPCLFPPREWTLNFQASELYAAIERWLGYHLAGHFPRELAIYELPEYFAWTPLSVLAPRAVFKHMEGKHAGRFSVDELLGHDLGLLWSVDQKIIGKELLDAVAPRRTRKTQRHPSRWYRLDEEPRPVQNTVELQRVLADSGHQADFTKRPREKELIALVFRDAALGEERLLLLDIGVASKKARPDVVKGWAVRAPQLYVISHEELFRRLQGVRDVGALEQKRAVCFGLGAIGSPFALALAREGVGSFLLCDPDTLRPGNVVRHALDLLSVGQFKAEAVESALTRINPSVETAIETSHLTDPGVISAKLRNASLVIAAIGEDLTEELIGEVVVRSDERPPLILARTLHGGAAFRVVLMRPGIDACLTCLAEYQAERHSDWIRIPADDRPDVFDDGCATPARPGAGLASQHAATFAAGRALEVLEKRAGETNHWLWVDRPIPDADQRLASGPTLHQARFPPRTGCPVCGV